MKKTLKIAATLFASASLTNAATIISSNFDRNTGAFALAGNADNTSGAGNTLTVTWTGDESASGSVLQSISPGGGFAITNGGANALSNNNLAFINHNLNIADRANPRGYSFTFTPTVAYNLTSLTLLSGHANNAATDQAFASDLTVAISGGVFSNTTNVDYGDAGPAIETQNLDLTGNSLAAGTEYTITVTTANMPSGGAYVVYDGITLEGTAVPEPSSTALIGLAGLGFILRRRR